ncbi:MAG: ATP-binding protein [Chloroflexota bacterium]
MIERQVAGGAQVPAAALSSDQSEDLELFGAVTSPLPPAPLAGLEIDQQLSLILERMMTAAHADSGAILRALPNGQLVVSASDGLSSAAHQALPASVHDLSIGITVRGAQTGPEASDCAVTADDSQTVIWVPLDLGGQIRGAVRLGFADLRTLASSALQRIAMMANHAANIVEVARLAEQGTERQAELERVSAVLDEIDRMKAEFLSMISHELRTPLTAIIGYTDLLLREIHGPLNERQGHHQQAVRKAAHRLLGLINDLLDVNRLESGQISLQLEPVSLVEAVQRAVLEVEAAAHERGISLRLDLPSEAMTVTADRERLRQILVNLLDNAMKFTPGGGVVTVHVERQGETAAVAVQDSGVGVPPEQLSRIWDRFHQADSSSRRHFGGTGLGLAIVRHLVERHEGQVSAVSEGTGQGSTFAFTLPITGAAAQPVVPTEVPPEAPLVTPDRAPATVLVVDDDPDNREVITSVVRDLMGHRVAIAINGREALLRAEEAPDLILLDLRMPGLSGFDVARELRGNPATAEIPIVAITALNDEADRADALAAGCIGCVTKPFSEAVLTEAVSAALRSGERHTAP